MEKVADADGAGVAVAGVGEDDVVGTGQLVSHGEGRCAAVGGFDGIDVHVVMGKTTATDAHDGYRTLADAQLFDGFRHQAGHNAVTAAGTVAGEFIQVQGLAVILAKILHPLTLPAGCWFWRSFH